MNGLRSTTAASRDQGVRSEVLDLGRWRCQINGTTDVRLRLQSGSIEEKVLQEIQHRASGAYCDEVLSVEHRIDLVMDMNVESSLPPLTQPQQAEVENQR